MSPWVAYWDILETGKAACLPHGFRVDVAGVFAQAPFCAYTRARATAGPALRVARWLALSAAVGNSAGSQVRAGLFGTRRRRRWPRLGTILCCWSGTQLLFYLFYLPGTFMRA